MVAVADIAYVVYDHPDLDEAELLDPRRELGRSDLEPSPPEDLLDRFGERGRGRIAERAVTCEGSVEHRPQIVGDARGRSIEHSEIGVADAHEDLDLARTREQRAKHHELTEHDRGREQIAARVDFLTHNLFGRHVVWRAHRATGGGQPSVKSRRRDPQASRSSNWWRS